MLRIGFDMDGVLADFESAFHAVERARFGTEQPLRAVTPEAEEEAQAKGRENTAGANPAERPRQRRRRVDAVWRDIEATANFWEGLKPLDDHAVSRIRDLALRYRWEVFFITQRPATAGDTVQRQTQRWLVAQGFDLPSVLVLGGSRGLAARALRLDYHVDDNTQNCVDVASDSQARAILVIPDDDEATIRTARKLGIGTAPAIGACLDILEQASAAQAEPGVLRRIAAAVGWK